MENRTGHINVSVANCYAAPSYQSEITTQGVLGEAVEILESSEKFIKIRQSDTYESWISQAQVSPGFKETGKKIIVRSHFSRIYHENRSDSQPVKDAVIGSRLFAVDEDPAWYRIRLPGNETGWIAKEHFGRFPLVSKQGIVSLSREFLGYQYFWGGKTPKGIDCSGFTQLVYALLGTTLPRDSSAQKEQGPHFSDDFHDAEGSDLLFFGKDKKKVTHTAISLGKGKVIHSSGWVKINSMIKGEPDFDQELVHNFISVNRYLT